MAKKKALGKKKGVRSLPKYDGDGESFIHELWLDDSDHAIKYELRKSSYTDNRWHYRFLNLPGVSREYMTASAVGRDDVNQEALAFAIAHHQNHLLLQHDSQRKLIEGIKKISPILLSSIIMATSNRAIKLIKRSVRRLTDEHELSEAELSYVGVLLCKRKLAVSERALASAQKAHIKLITTQQKIRNNKCQAVAEQIEAIERDLNGFC